MAKTFTITDYTGFENMYAVNVTTGAKYPITPAVPGHVPGPTITVPGVQSAINIVSIFSNFIPAVVVARIDLNGGVTILKSEDFKPVVRSVTNTNVDVKIDFYYATRFCKQTRPIPVRLCRQTHPMGVVCCCPR